MKQSLLVFISALISLSFCGPTQAQNLSGNFDNAKIVAAIRKAKVLDATQPIDVKRFQDSAIITTLLNPKAKADDCKIDAMLISKAVMDTDKTIHLVRYRLKRDMNSDAFYLIAVKETDVKAYGASAINKDSLLAGLKVIPKKGLENRVKNFRKRRLQTM